MDDGLPLDQEGMVSGDPMAQSALAWGEKAAPKVPVKVTSAQDYEKVPHGAAYLDPEGKQRFKRLRNKADYDALDEGSEYADPQGQIRTKTKYGGVGFSAQTLYNIAHSDKGRKMALEKFYPGKVKDDPSGGFYVEDEGKFYKPGRGVSSVGGAIASEAIPTVLAGLGGLTGGAAGTAIEPGGGTVLGGAAGGYAGGYAGQRINDIFAQLAGVYDPEGGEANARMSGYMGAAGDVGGRALSAAAPTIKEGAQFVSRNASKLTGKFLGVNEEKLATALPIAEKGETEGTGILGAMGLRKPGTAVSPSAIFEKAPHVTNVSEVLEQAFDKSDTFKANTEKFMDDRARQIMQNPDIGKLVEDSFTAPKAAVSTEQAGGLLKDSYRAKILQESTETDARLAQELANRRAGITESNIHDIEAQRSRSGQVVKAAEDAKVAADELVQQAFREIEKSANNAMTVAKAGYNSGDLMRTTAQQLVGAKKALSSRANKMYDDAEIASGGLVPRGANELAQPAQQLIEELPDGFESLHPSITKKLRDIAGIKDEKTGEWIKEPADASWVQLHNLRSQIRQDIKWNDLGSDVRNGTLKFLESKINTVLHDVENNSELKDASRLLKLADSFYRDNIGPFNSLQLRQLVKALDTPGIQADPKVLLGIAIRDGKTEVAELIKKHVGAQTWEAMRAADVKEMLAQSQTLAGRTDGVAFAKQVLDRKRNGVLETLHGKEGADKLLKQAQYVDALRGKLEIPVQPGDRIGDIILRARAMAATVEERAARDPFTVMKEETNAAMKEHAAAVKAAKTAREQQQLAFLLDPNVGANAAADRILKSPDLIVAASRAFPGGEQSPEFNLIRQIWTERFLRGGTDVSGGLGETSAEVQALMWPGVSLSDMHMLAKEMDLLTSGATVGAGSRDMSAGMMTRSAVEHPIGQAKVLNDIAGPMKWALATPVLRAGLSTYFTGVRKLATSPSTLRWLRKGLQSRDPAERESARAELKAYLQRGGAMGAAATENAYQRPEQ